MGLLAYGGRMAGLTAAQLQARLDAYLASELKILNAQDYSADGLRVQRAALAEVREGIRETREQLDALSSPSDGASAPIVVEFGDPA